ncbi:putative ribonuclease H protein, partial [Trifolium medium]|nr:putative ribonuclease H protein [Trifolium medium]
MLILEQVRPTRDAIDRRRWKPHAAGVFSVKTAYIDLQYRFGMNELETNTVKALKTLWKNNVPSKFSIFGWRLLLEKLPTRVALYNKGIITNTHDICCVMCFKDVEDTQHIFFQCPDMLQIWNNIFNWMGIHFPSSVEGANHFIIFGDIVS